MAGAEDKYKGKYRIPSARWSEWDYGANAAYFVTICTAHRERLFGNIANGIMTFTEIGQVAYDCWTMIPEHFPFVKLGAFVIMPNHVHGVIVIDKHEQTTSGCDAGDNVLLQQQQQWQQNKFGPQSQNLGSIIRGFKVGVTKYATAAAIPFGWQTRFNDRVIRNHDELMRIEQYINNNIENWNDDELYKEIK